MALRRTVLKWFVSAAASLPLPALARRTSVTGELDRNTLLALAEAVLPSELGQDGQANAADAFLRWLSDYRAGAELDHGYGDPRLAQAPGSPAARYRTQVADLQRRCGGALSRTALAARRRIIAQALDEAGVRALPPLPDGAHVVTDLMSHYFNGPDANDRVHGRYIGRFACRGLPGSEDRPPPLSGKGAA
jgi:hypothetical protein